MDKIDQILLENLLEDPSFQNWTNKTNKNDIQYWNNWIYNNPDKIETVESAKSIILGIKFKKQALSDDMILGKLDAVLSKLNSSKIELGGSSIVKVLPVFKKIMATAATIALIIVLGYQFLDAPSTIVHKTTFGEIINLKLPDGTSVLLNGNSEITYQKNNPRNIVLKGEAYFKVKPIPATEAKFWVNTEDLTVEVFGTSFHVSTRNRKTDVVLDEGSIHLDLKNGNIQKMIPGEMVSFSKDNKKVSHNKVTKDLSYALWRDGTYVFNNITLSEVMKNIEEAYGLSTEFMEDDIKQKLISGGIPNENLEICLSAIEKSTGTRIVRKDNKLLIFNNSIQN